MTEHETNIVFFAGSVFFTLAAYLQLFQSANAGMVSTSTDAPKLRSILGWRPIDPGWLSSSTQFAGTILFNASTYNAIQGGNWQRQDLTIWAPDFLGSTFFLFAGYLALIETCHGWWAWQARSLSWWVVVVNFFGCVAFIISAVFAFVPPSGLHSDIVAFSNFFTLIGAIFFLFWCPAVDLGKL